MSEPQETLTVGKLRNLLDQYELDPDAPVLISVYNDQWDQFDKLAATAAEVRDGFNAPAALVLAHMDPEKALG